MSPISRSGLEYLVCQEIDGLKRQGLRRFWCDGFIPERYEPPRITPEDYVKSIPSGSTQPAPGNLPNQD